MKKLLLGLVFFVLMIIETMSDLDGAISFLNKIGINTTFIMVTIKLIASILHILYPLIIGYCIYQIYNLNKKTLLSDIYISEFLSYRNVMSAINHYRGIKLYTDNRDANNVSMDKNYLYWQNCNIEIKEIYKDLHNSNPNMTPNQWLNILAKIYNLSEEKIKEIVK